MTLIIRYSLLAAITLALTFAISPSIAQPNAYHLVKTIHLTGDGGWDYLTMDSATRRLYIARGSHVTVVNVDSGRVVGDIPNLQGIHGVAIDHKSGHGFISNGRTNAVTIFSLSTLKKLGDIPVGQGPDAILFDPDTSRIFTFDGMGNTTTAINTKTNKVIGTIPLPGKPEFPVADGAGRIYDNIEDKSEVVAINTRSMKVEHIWSVAPGDSPSGIAMDSKRRRLFSVCHNQLMTVMNADTGMVVGMAKIGNGPDAVAFDATDHLAFSSNGRDGTVTGVQELPGDRYAVIATIPTKLGARTMAFDSNTGRVITVTAEAIPPKPGDWPHMRRYVAGSFVVLEYGR